jgi:putative peptide zinc metalloprotease protein
VRAGANGFVADFLVQPGTRVEKGTPLVQSYEPTLDTQRRRSEGKVAELEAEYSAAYVADRAKAQIAQDKLDSERANLTLIRSRVSDLLVRANYDGVLVLPQMADMHGRYFRKGEQMGYVVGDVRPIVRVVVPQNAVDKVRTATHDVSVRLADRPDVVIGGTVLREVPAGADMLPSLALSVEGGGEIATDPREAKGPKSLERMFQFDLQLDDSTRLEYFGQRAFVRFNHLKEPLLVQWYRNLRLLFLSSFNV